MELLLFWAVIDALLLVIVELLVEDVVKPLLVVVLGVGEEIVLVVLGFDEEIVLVVVVNAGRLVVLGVDEEIMLVVVVDGGLLSTVVLLATKIVPSTIYPEPSTQLPGVLPGPPKVKHDWLTSHDQAWFVPRIKPQQMCSTSRQTSPQAR